MTGDLEIVIYPNPNNGKFMIEMENGGWKMGNGNLSIYNMLGERICFSELKQRTSNEIDLSGYLDGIYFVTVYTGDKVYFGKIVKQ